MKLEEILAKGISEQNLVQENDMSDLRFSILIEGLVEKADEITNDLVRNNIVEKISANQNTEEKHRMRKYRNELFYLVYGTEELMNDRAYKVVESVNLDMSVYSGKLRIDEKSGFFRKKKYADSDLIRDDIEDIIEYYMNPVNVEAEIRKVIQIAKSDTGKTKKYIYAFWNVLLAMVDAQAGEKSLKNLSEMLYMLKIKEAELEVIIIFINALFCDEETEKENMMNKIAETEIGKILFQLCGC